MKAFNPDLIITDENHHSLAATYKKIYRAFLQAKRLGVTATPERLDGSGLKDVNDILIEGVNAQWLMEHDYLSPYDYYAPNIRLPKFHIRQGDFDLAEMNGYFRQHLPQIYGDVLAHYRRLADGKQAICYLSGVEVSRQTAALFTESGIPSAHIDGGTPKEERDRLIHAFRTGRIRILCNVDIISEGFDVPDCECVILLRPTKSLTLYIQQSMRCYALYALPSRQEGGYYRPCEQYPYTWLSGCTAAVAVGRTSENKRNRYGSCEMLWAMLRLRSVEDARKLIEEVKV